MTNNTTHTKSNGQPYKYYYREKEYKRNYMREYMGRKMTCVICDSQICIPHYEKHCKTEKHKKNMIVQAVLLYKEDSEDDEEEEEGCLATK